MKPTDDLICVRYSGGTYVARWCGKRASCSEGFFGAAVAVADKALGKDKLFSLTEVGDGDHLRRSYSAETDIDSAAFAAVAELRPHVAHASDPDRFWKLFSKRYPHATRAQMEQLLRETEPEDQQGKGA